MGEDMKTSLKYESCESIIKVGDLLLYDSSLAVIVTCYPSSGPSFSGTVLYSLLSDKPVGLHLDNWNKEGFKKILNAEIKFEG